MIDIKELDKRLMFQDAWKHNTPYSTLLICNGATAHRLALTLGIDKLDSYKGHAVKIDNELDVVIEIDRDDNSSVGESRYAKGIEEYPSQIRIYSY